MAEIKAPDMERQFVDAIESGEIDGDIIALDAEGKPVKRKRYPATRRENPDQK